jgi:hypothetical protein
MTASERSNGAVSVNAKRVHRDDSNPPAVTLAPDGWPEFRASRARRRKLFDNKYYAGVVCRELRNLCPRNAEVINIEVAQDDPSGEVIPLTFSPFVET